MFHLYGTRYRQKALCNHTVQSCVSQSVFEKVGKLQSVRVQNVPQLQSKHFQGQDIRENQIERL